jgi:hypothetical protein
MKGRMVVLAAVALAVTLTSVAAGGSTASKQRVAITMKFHESTFALFPFQAGAVKSDLGRMTDNAPNAPC